MKEPNFRFSAKRFSGANPPPGGILTFQTPIHPPDPPPLIDFPRPFFHIPFSLFLLTFCFPISQSSTALQGHSVSLSLKAPPSYNDVTLAQPIALFVAQSNLVPKNPKSAGWSTVPTCHTGKTKLLAGPLESSLLRTQCDPLTSSHPSTWMTIQQPSTCLLDTCPQMSFLNFSSPHPAQSISPALPSQPLSFFTPNSHPPYPQQNPLYFSSIKLSYSQIFSYLDMGRKIEEIN